MRILLVDDQSDHIDSYKWAIKRYDENIEVVEVYSFEELQQKLLTDYFDAAIVDNNLKLWRYLEHFPITTGVQLCDMLQETKNFKNIQSKVFLYSAYENISNDNGNRKYTITRKLNGKDIKNRFHAAFLEKITGNQPVRPPVSMNTFKNYPQSKQIRYYKNIIDKDVDHFRFADVDQEVLWASNLKGNNNEELIGYRANAVKATTDAATQYNELDNIASESETLPALFWNYSSPEFFHEQEQTFRSVYFKNGFIELFFKINYAYGLAPYLINLPEESTKFFELVKIMPRTDYLLQREVQCKIIDTMIRQEQGEELIQKKLKSIKDISGFQVVDYFEGYLDFYDKDRDIAQVRLTSLLNDSHYKREFSYIRLESQGVVHKDAKFLYWVLEYGNEIHSHIEPL